MCAGEDRGAQGHTDYTALTMQGAGPGVRQ